MKRPFYLIFPSFPSSLIFLEASLIHRGKKRSKHHWNLLQPAVSLNSEYPELHCTLATRRAITIASPSIPI